MKIEKKALKILNKMPKKTAQKFYDAFDLIESGRIESLDIKNMEGRDGFRLRIGQYRAIFTNDFELVVIKVGARGDVYK